jgi:hypothetical protein
MAPLHYHRRTGTKGAAILTHKPYNSNSVPYASIPHLLWKVERQENT